MTFEKFQNAFDDLYKAKEITLDPLERELTKLTDMLLLEHRELTTEERNRGLKIISKIDKIESLFTQLDNELINIRDQYI